MEQIARNVTMEESGILANCRYLLHDRDSECCQPFRHLIEAEKIKALALPPQSPNLNAYAERWVRSVKDECLSKLILFGERSLKRALLSLAKIRIVRKMAPLGPPQLKILSGIGPWRSQPMIRQAPLRKRSHH